MKLKITLLLSFVIAFNLSAQKIEATAIYNDGRVAKGRINRMNQQPDFARISPFYYFISLFNGEYSNPFDNSGFLKNNLKIKLDNETKATKIPIEELDKVIVHASKKKYTVLKNEEVTYKAIVGENLYKRKKAGKNVQDKALLPIATQGKMINTYGVLIPLRNLLLVGPFIFELTVPDAAGIIYLENKEKNTVISYNYIIKEKALSARKAKKRKEKNNHLNHNSLEVLFGDCPESQKLIDEFYIKRIEDKSKRKEMAKAYNKKLLLNRKKFKQAIASKRKNATVDLFMSTYLFDLNKIIQTYEKNCNTRAIDEFDPRHENYKKEYDLQNRDIQETSSVEVIAE